MNVSMFIVSFSICVSLQLANGAREINIKINDLDKLEASLANQGASDVLIRTIYAAANCDLRRNQILDKKLDRLLSPMDGLHQKVNEVLNKINNNKAEIKTAMPIDTTQIIINMGADQRQLNEEFEEFDANSVDQRSVVSPLQNMPSYAPLVTRELHVTPDLCRTVESMANLSRLAASKRADILSIAKNVYDYKGGNSISDFARFYVRYVGENYDMQNQVMGLAKLLGDYASTTSEHFILDNTMTEYKEPCGHMRASLRKKRNVLPERLSGGKCMKEIGDPVNRHHNSSCFSKIPHSRNLMLNLFVTINKKCKDVQSLEHGAAEREDSETIIAAGLEEGKPCVTLRFCNDADTVLTSEKVCKKSVKTPICTSNVDNLRMSLISGRFTSEDLPTDLRLMNKHYCSINGHVYDATGSCSRPIKTMQRFTLFLLDKEWRASDKDILIAHGQDVTNLCYYDCTGCKNNCTRCKGDETYISNFGSWPSATCSCSYCHDCSELFVQVEDSRFGVDATLSVEWPVTIPVEEEKEIECSSCKATCSSFKIKIERDMSFDILHFCVENNCRVIIENKPDFVYNVPEEFKHSTNFIIHYFRSDGKGKRIVKVTCSDSHTCESLTCDVCLTRFANPHCYKFVNWVVLITGVSALILTIPLLFTLYTLAKLLLLLLLIPSKAIWRCFKLLTKLMLRVTNKKVKETTIKMNNILKEEELKEVKSVKPYRAVDLLFLVAIFSVPVCLGCENSITLTSKSNDCVTNSNNVMKCVISSVTDIPLSSLGEESCLRLTDPLGHFSQLVKIKTKGLRQKCSRNILYHTVEPEFKLHNTFRCRNAGDCVNDVCERVKVSDTVPVDSVDEKKAGIGGCLRVTGFWGKGCFYPSQACQFYKIELDNSKRLSYEIFDCKEWFWEILVEITTEDHQVQTSEVKELISGVPVKTSLGFVQLLTVVAPVIKDLNGCFARRQSGITKTSLITCSTQSKFESGKVGGIQCATASLANSASRSCIIDSTQAQIVPQDDNLVFVNNFANITEDWSRNILPTNFTSSVISEDKEGTVFIQYSGKAAYTLRIKLKDYKVGHLVNKPKCEAHFRHLTGCSNCGSGATVIIEVILAPASKTPGTLYCPSAVSPSSALLNSAKPKSAFKVAFSRPEVNEECLFECGGANMTVQVEGRLLQVVNLIESEEKKSLGKYYDYFASLPWFHFGALRYFYLFIGTLVITPLLVLIYRAIKVGIWSFCKKGRKMHSYIKSQ
ncbi:glycoprotein precursor [Phasivirus baduense]|uniref:Glycoprotein n=1 Tax=Phasivirus baduense TaxID=3052627 RepID=A0A125QXS0_9VIRU|nr:glycoprotein precursor [Phasivirus baduense]AMA19447.1 glycoprotein precursor [Phasivirus baduense]